MANLINNIAMSVLYFPANINNGVSLFSLAPMMGFFPGIYIQSAYKISKLLVYRKIADQAIKYVTYPMNAFVL